jgi:PAS domain S-box-containing protein
MRLGLRGRFVAFVSAIVIAFGVVLTALAVRVQTDRVRHELEERGKLLTTVVASHAVDPLALFDVRGLRLMLGETLQQENVVDAVAFDEEGRIITDGTVKNPRRHELIHEAARRHLAASDSLLVEFEGDVMTVTKPIRLGGRTLGGVSLRYSLAGLAEHQAVLARRTTLVGAVFAVFGVLAAALLTEAVTRPLKEVIRATTAVSEGEPVPHLPVRTSDEVGELAAAFNVMTRRLRETTVSRDYLDRVLETMGESLVVTGADGAVSRVNKALCELVGAPEEELIGRHCGELFRAPEGYVSLLHAVSSEGRVQGLETDLLTIDGRAIPVMASIAEMAPSPSRGKGFVVVAADLRERLRVERQKDEFVTMVHHEVRTPLTAVRGAIGLLCGGVAGGLDARARDLVEIALRNSERMERLVDDILVSRKLDSGRMDFHFEETRLAPLVEQAVEATSVYAEKFDVLIELENTATDAKVKTDPDRLIQVMNNVLSNAVRFTSAGDAVVVGVTRSNTGLRVAVSDKGPGIAEDFRDMVFEPFSRGLENDWRHRSGSGLGMSISKGIMEELGGSISFETQIGVGTTFFVDIPEAG